MKTLKDRALKHLLEESFKTGFCYRSIEMVAKQLDVKPEELLDSNTESGALWDFDCRSDSHEAGFLDFIRGAVAVNRERQGEIEFYLQSQEVEYCRNCGQPILTHNGCLNCETFGDGVRVF
jgi:hypothetical protein